MSSAEEPRYNDLSQFEAEFGGVSRLQETREEALRTVQRLWGSVRGPNDTLPTTRRFIISGTANALVPVSHERMTLIPKPRASRISDIESVRVSVPYLSGDGAEQRLDPRFAFVELCHPDAIKTPWLLAPGEFSRYGRAGDIRVINYEDDRTYTVDTDTVQAIRAASAVLSFEDIDQDFPPDSLPRQVDEETALAELAAILDTYDPDLQDNLRQNV